MFSGLKYFSEKNEEHLPVLFIHIDISWIQNYKYVLIVTSIR